MRSLTPTPLSARLRQAAVILGATLTSVAPVAAQPFRHTLVLDGHPQHGGIQTYHSTALNPKSAFTLEAWVKLENVAGCRTIAGKNYEQSWGVFVCPADGKPTLRSYLAGSGSARTAGVVPAGQWTHIAVVYDGAARRHYINGELAGSWAQAGQLPGSTSALRVGSDVAWEYTPKGRIDEVRLWNVARTQAELRAAINVPIASPQPGLVALWAFDGNAWDGVGSHHGGLFGAGASLPTASESVANCWDLPTALCIQDERFLIHVSWRKPDGTTGSGKVVQSSADSGLWWFFAETNWELMIKVLDACALNDHYWVFSAATTNVFYRIDVLDVLTGTSKVYFNYPGPPAPAVTDTTAFATCV